MTYITIESVRNYSNEDANEQDFSGLISKGILQDYANLEFDD